jgi:hypothetical protein
MNWGLWPPPLLDLIICEFYLWSTLKKSENEKSTLFGRTKISGMKFSLFPYRNMNVYHEAHFYHVRHASASEQRVVTFRLFCKVM